MQSFRTELENPIVEKDIVELERKIYEFKHGTLAEESFRSLRLARGIYGQRQQGVQMVRIKFPLGIVSSAQLRRVADISEEYSNGNLHLTTRQDIQLHHVSLDKTPELWSDLEKDNITIREACGNTVRNITASPLAGADPDEPFDITPFGFALFDFFLRNPIGQELGRKFKIALSSSSKDTARVYLHDLGLIPIVKNNDVGFRVVIAGGLGAQPVLAEVISEFLPANQLLKFGEALLRVFDKFGERNKRHKARLKYLIKEEGLDFVKQQIEYHLQFTQAPELNLDVQLNKTEAPNFKPVTDVTSHYSQWLNTNVFAQKQKDYFAVLIKIRNGNLSSVQAKKLADTIEYYSSEPARITIDQNILLRSVSVDLLHELFTELSAYGFADYGAGRITDITSCPGTSTCNLGITSTYNVANVIEKLLFSEFNEFIFEEELEIKISGCMNSCGQHAVADIGFHGSSFNANGNVIPALQLVLGGANLGNGRAAFAEKIIKIPTKRVEQVVRILLYDFKNEKTSNEKFYAYYLRKGKNYFYELLKPVADVNAIHDDEMRDWGSDEKYKTEIGVGECAGVKIDLTKTLLFEAEEKLAEAEYFFLQSKFADAAYTIYSSLIQAAKAYLLTKGVETNSKAQIEQAFEPWYFHVAENLNAKTFGELVLQSHEAGKSVNALTHYIASGKQFIQNIQKNS